VVGANVFVCDNLSFSGEIRIARRHTRFIMRDIPRLTANAVGQLSLSWNKMEDRINHYREHELSDAVVHDLCVRSIDVGAITASQLPRVVKEWREPRHPEFKDRNVWSFFNSTTEVLKESGLSQVSRRTIALHGLLDAEVGLGKGLLEGVTDSVVE